jgi:hypothetical protein
MRIGREAAASHSRRAAARLGLLIVLYNVVLVARHDWAGMVIAPVAAALVLVAGYGFGVLWRHQRRA